MALRLYTNPMSRGRIARWMLEEVGQPYEVEFVDYGTAMQSAAYRAINPMGKVPALLHDGRVVTESAAICAYLADAFPEAGLAPADRSAYYRWLFFGAGPLEAAIITAALGVTVPDDKRATVGFRDLGTTQDVLEAWLRHAGTAAGLCRLRRPAWPAARGPARRRRRRRRPRRGQGGPEWLSRWDRSSAQPPCPPWAKPAGWPSRAATPSARY
jgi:glutathione S-transferase